METFNKGNRWTRMERCSRWTIVLREQKITQSSVALKQRQTWEKSVLRLFSYLHADCASLSGHVQSSFWRQSTDKIWIYAEAVKHLSFQWSYIQGECLYMLHECNCSKATCEYITTIFIPTLIQNIKSCFVFDLIKMSLLSCLDPHPILSFSTRFISSQRG